MQAALRTTNPCVQTLTRNLMFASITGLATATHPLGYASTMYGSAIEMFQLYGKSLVFGRCSGRSLEMSFSQAQACLFTNLVFVALRLCRLVSMKLRSDEMQVALCRCLSIVDGATFSSVSMVTTSAWPGQDASQTSDYCILPISKYSTRLVLVVPARQPARTCTDFIRFV